MLFLVNADELQNLEKSTSILKRILTCALQLSF